MTSHLIDTRYHRRQNNMAQSLFNQKRTYWKARSSLVKLDAQDSSTDCTLNLDIQQMDSTSSRHDRSESKAMYYQLALWAV